MALLLILTAVMVLLHIVDVVTTMKALARGMDEKNPLARTVFGFLGPLGGSIALKVGVSAPMLWVLWAYPHLWYLFAGYTFVLAAVVANNAFELAD